MTPQETALQRAMTEWSRHVEEPPGKNWERIATYIREGLGWPNRYTRNRDFEWCGAFAAFCWAAVKPALRKEHFASTYRLRKWARGTPRYIDPSALQPGDIVVVGSRSGHRWGEHVTLCESVGPLGILTVEGNAIGAGPDGQRHEGVIRRIRPFEVADLKTKRVLYGVRPLPEDLSP